MKTLQRFPLVVAASALLLTLAACGNGGPSESERIAAFKARALASAFHPSEAEVERTIKDGLSFPSCEPAKSGTAFVCPVLNAGPEEQRIDMVLQKVDGTWTVIDYRL
jgi:hypothetical protein